MRREIRRLGHDPIVARGKPLLRRLTECVISPRVGPCPGIGSPDQEFSERDTKRDLASGLLEGVYG